MQYKRIWISWDMAREICGGEYLLRRITARYPLQYEGALITLRTGAVLAVHKTNGLRRMYLYALRWKDIDAIVDGHGRVKPRLTPLYPRR